MLSNDNFTYPFQYPSVKVKLTASNKFFFGNFNFNNININGLDIKNKLILLKSTLCDDSMIVDKFSKPIFHKNTLTIHFIWPSLKPF